MNLHNEVMNLPCEQPYDEEDKAGHCYAAGHRDARHAAAELALKAEERIEELESSVSSLASANEEMICVLAGIKWVLSSLGATNTVAYRDVEAILDKAMGEPK